MCDTEYTFTYSVELGQYNIYYYLRNADFSSLLRVPSCTRCLSFAFVSTPRCGSVLQFSCDSSSSEYRSSASWITSGLMKLAMKDLIRKSTSLERQWILEARLYSEKYEQMICETTILVSQLLLPLQNQAKP